MGASDEEDQVHVKQPLDPVRVDAQMRRTTPSSATIGVAPDLRLGTRRACAGRFAWASWGAAQQGVPREENA